MARVKARIGAEHYKVEMEGGGHAMVADEPAVRGGGNAGPSPYDLLLAGLAACTAITLRMYGERKQWDLKSATVDVRYFREGDSERIERRLGLEGNLSAEQRARMADIAERTPVTLTLKRGLSIVTELEPPPS